MLDKDFERAVVSCGGLGYSPWAPGTVASVVALLTYHLLIHFFSPGLVIGLTAGFLIIGFWAAEEVIDSPRSDPSWIVMDEWVAMWGLLLYLPNILWVHILGLLLFRLLDIAKPWPVCTFQLLPGAVGIFADDIAAVFLTGIFLCCVVIPLF